MKKIFSVFLLSILTAFCYAQRVSVVSNNGTINVKGGTSQVMPTYIPAGSGAPANLLSWQKAISQLPLSGNDIRTSALYWDSTGNALYAYDPDFNGWRNIAGGSGTPVDSVINRSHPYIDSLFYYTGGTAHFIYRATHPDGLIKPGIVTKTATTTFSVTSALYSILGTIYTSTDTTQVLAALPASGHQRQDVIYVLDTKKTSHQTGTLDAGTHPTISPDTAVILAVINVYDTGVSVIAGSSTWALDGSGNNVNINPSGNVIITKSLLQGIGIPTAQFYTGRLLIDQNGAHPRLFSGTGLGDGSLDIHTQNVTTGVHFLTGGTRSTDIAIWDSGYLKHLLMLNSAAGSDKMVVWDSVTHRFNVRAIPGGGGTPTLQQVTDAGNSFTAGFNLKDVSNNVLAAFGDFGPGGDLQLLQVGTSAYAELSPGSLTLINAAGGSGDIGVANLSVGGHFYELPNTGSSHTIPISVNGNFANTAGDVTLSTGSGTVTSVARTNGYGIAASVANPTTTPNITIAVDTATIYGDVRAWIPPARDLHFDSLNFTKDVDTLRASTGVLSGGIVYGGVKRDTASTNLQWTGASLNITGALYTDAGAGTQNILATDNVTLGSGAGTGIVISGSTALTPDIVTINAVNGTTVNGGLAATTSSYPSGLFLVRNDGVFKIGDTEGDGNQTGIAGSDAAGTIFIGAFAGLNINAPTSIVQLSAGGIVKAAPSTGLLSIATGTLSNFGQINYSTPTTGSTISSIVGSNIVEPAGTLLALTVNLPGSPNNGDIAAYTFTQAITGLTFANGTVVNTLTTAASGGTVKFIFYNGTSKWYKWQ